MAETKGLLIFDFDQTLCNKHLFNIYKTSKDFLDTYNNFTSESDKKRFTEQSFNDFHIIKNIFSCLKKQGYQICIASFGHQNMLEKYIEYSYGHDLIPKENIAGSGGIKEYSDYNETYGWSSKSEACGYGINCKNHMIIHFMNKYKVNKNDVVFFDDDEKNINYAKDKELGIHCINNPKTGIEIKHIIEGINKLNIDLTDKCIEFNIYYIKYIKYKKKYLQLKKLI
jgi:hypothetical protein